MTVNDASAIDRSKTVSYCSSLFDFVFLGLKSQSWQKHHHNVCLWLDSFFFEMSVDCVDEDKGEK